MTMNYKDIVIKLFRLLCLLTAISMSIYWCYRFSLNEGTSAINYRKLSLLSEDPIIPTLSLCFKNPFLQDRLSEFGTNEDDYLSFLEGEYFDKKMLSIDFNLVTINITKYIKGYHVAFNNGSKLNSDSIIIKKMKDNCLSNTFNGFIYGRFWKCYSFHTPKINNLQIFRVRQSNKLFKDGLRPMDDTFSAWIHLPQQFLLPSNTEKWTWPYRVKKSIYKSRFLIKSFEIYKKRNTETNTCTENWKIFNNWTMELFEKEIGCRSPYQIIDKTYEICDSQDEIRRSFNYRSLVADGRYQMPCNTLENLHVNFLESEIKGVERKDFGHFQIGIHFIMSSYKEITNTRYQFHSFEYYYAKFQRNST